MENKAAHHKGLTEKKSVHAYLLMKFDDSVDLIEVYRQFHSMDHVSNCVAARGDYHLILMLQADNFETINEIVENRIMTVEGISEAALMPVEAQTTIGNVNENIHSVGKTPGRDRGENERTDNLGHAKTASSYIFLEIEKETGESLYPALCLNDSVAICDRTRGKFDIAMWVRGASFTEIDHMIQNKIRPLAGVLRIKELPVIQLFEM